MFTSFHTNFYLYLFQASQFLIFFLWIDKKITKFKTFEKNSTNFTREINNTIFKQKKKQMFLDKKMASIKAEGL